MMRGKRGRTETGLFIRLFLRQLHPDPWHSGLSGEMKKPRKCRPWKTRSCSCWISRPEIFHGASCLLNSFAPSIFLDFLCRGMATEDPRAPHGSKLAGEDYPFADDGLLLRDAMKEWATEYVNYFYQGPILVKSDVELRAWWTAIRTVRQGDKKEGWTASRTQKDLVDIIASIILAAPAHLGQSTCGGFFPSRPTIARNSMSTEDYSEEDRNRFVRQPEQVLIESQSDCPHSPVIRRRKSTSEGDWSHHGLSRIPRNPPVGDSGKVEGD